METPIGFVPRPEDIDLDGTDVSEETLRKLLTVDPALWRAEAAGIREFYAKFGEKLPKTLADELERLEKAL